MDILDKLYQKGVSRRNFLVSAGAAGAVAALAGCNDAATTTTSTGSIAYLTDADILTFALNLEYLEAEFYLYAATGAGLSAADAGISPGTTIVPSVTKLTGLNTAQQNIVNEIAYDEQTHVQFLRAAIGPNVVSRPPLDLTFFGPLAVAAGITGPAFSPFTSFDNYLLGGFIFEDVGVTAYNGAAPLISPAGVKAGLLSAAAGIMAVEAYHSAYFRTVLTGLAIANPGTSAGSTTYTPFNNAVLVQTLRSTLGGGGETTLVVPSTANPASAIVNANSSALAFSRTSDQVHHIVYGNGAPGAARGGFFPNGTNYRFSATTT